MKAMFGVALLAVGVGVFAISFGTGPNQVSVVNGQENVRPSNKQPHLSIGAALAAGGLGLLVLGMKERSSGKS